MYTHTYSANDVPWFEALQIHQEFELNTISEVSVDRFFLTLTVFKASVHFLLPEMQERLILFPVILEQSADDDPWFGALQIHQELELNTT